MVSKVLTILNGNEKRRRAVLFWVLIASAFLSFFLVISHSVSACGSCSAGWDYANAFCYVESNNCGSGCEAVVSGSTAESCSCTCVCAEEPPSCYVECRYDSDCSVSSTSQKGICASYTRSNGCGQSCTGLSCSTSSCPSGYLNCDEKGGCECHISAGYHCSNDHCCPSGETWCGSSCVDTNTDDNNCGSCGHSCGANSHCVDGDCECDTGWSDCNDDDSCECHTGDGTHTCSGDSCVAEGSSEGSGGSEGETTTLDASFDVCSLIECQTDSDCSSYLSGYRCVNYRCVLESCGNGEVQSDEDCEYSPESGLLLATNPEWACGSGENERFKYCNPENCKLFCPDLGENSSSNSLLPSANEFCTKAMNALDYSCDEFDECDNGDQADEMFYFASYDNNKNVMGLNQQEVEDRYLGLIDLYFSTLGSGAYNRLNYNQPYISSDAMNKFVSFVRGITDKTTGTEFYKAFGFYPEELYHSLIFVHCRAVGDDEGSCDKLTPKNVFAVLPTLVDKDGNKYDNISAYTKVGFSPVNITFGPGNYSPRCVMARRVKDDSDFISCDMDGESKEKVDWVFLKDGTPCDKGAVCVKGKCVNVSELVSPHMRTRAGDSTLEWDIYDSSDMVCCQNITDCVNNSICYQNGTVLGDLDGDGDLDYCNNGKWSDCIDDSQCLPTQACISGDCKDKKFRSYKGGAGACSGPFNHDLFPCYVDDSSGCVKSGTTQEGYFCHNGTWYPLTSIDMATLAEFAEDVSKMSCSAHPEEVFNRINYKANGKDVSQILKNCVEAGCYLISSSKKVVLLNVNLSCSDNFPSYIFANKGFSDVVGSDFNQFTETKLEDNTYLYFNNYSKQLIYSNVSLSSISSEFKNDYDDDSVLAPLYDTVKNMGGTDVKNLLMRVSKNSSLLVYQNGAVAIWAKKAQEYVSGEAVVAVRYSGLSSELASFLENLFNARCYKVLELESLVKKITDGDTSTLLFFAKSYDFPYFSKWYSKWWPGFTLLLWDKIE